jgi:hypothetical protein
MGLPLVWPALDRGPRAPWLWSRGVDLVVIGGAGSIAFIVLGAVASSLWAGVGAALITAFLHLSVVCNGPHYAATYQLVIRERQTQQRNWLVTVGTAPAVLAVLLLVGHWPTAWLAPFTRLYLTLSPHHYATQHFGVAALYCGRRGRPLDQGEKRLLRFAFLGVGGFMMILANTFASDAQGIIGIPPSAYISQAGLPPESYYGALGLVVASLWAAGLAERRVRQRTGRGMDGIVWLLLAVNVLWFVVPNLRLPGASGPWVPPLAGAALIAGIPFFHCAQYLGVVGHRARSSGPVRPVLLLAVLAAGGLAIFVGMARVTSHMTPIDAARATLLVDAVFNLHHFLLDAVIWRRTRPAAGAPIPAPAL